MRPMSVEFEPDWSYLPDLRKMHEQRSPSMSGLPSEVLGPKQHSEIWEVMNEETTLVFASYWEVMPTMLLEAMASCIPVMSTAAGQMPSIMRDEETGFLIDHTYGGFERAVLGVLNDGPDVDSITKRASELAGEEFNLGVVIRKLDTVYREISLQFLLTTVVVGS